MGPLLTPYIIIIFSIGMGSAICYFCFGFAVVFKVAVGWSIIITLAIFTNMWLVVAATVAFVVLIKNEPPELKVLYYVALLPVLPLEPYQIPFPALNYLWELSFVRALILIFLFPLLILFFNNLSKGITFFRSSDRFFVLFVILNILLFIARSNNVTNTMRTIFSIFVDFGIPYFVVSRFISTPMNLNWVLSLFLIGASFLSAVSIFESLLGWRMYGQILISLGLEYSPIAFVPYARDGLVRASGGSILQPLAYAYYVSLAIVVAFYLMQQKILKFIPAVLLISLLFVGLMFTSSRGGLLTFIVGMMMLYYMKLGPNMKLLATVIGIIGIVMMIGYFNTAGFSEVDSQGTFEYRTQLIKNSLHAVSQNLFFGSNDYINDANLARSLQGEGIIDIVNYYLQITLEMGLVGLILFIMAFVMTIIGVWSKRNVEGMDHKNLLVTLLVMSLVFVATCSAVSFIPVYLYFFLAVSRAYIDFPEQHNQGLR